MLSMFSVILVEYSWIWYLLFKIKQLFISIYLIGTLEYKIKKFRTYFFYLDIPPKSSAHKNGYVLFWSLSSLFILGDSCSCELNWHHLK